MINRIYKITEVSQSNKQIKRDMENPMKYIHDQQKKKGFNRVKFYSLLAKIEIWLEIVLYKLKNIKPIK